VVSFGVVVITILSTCPPFLFQLASSLPRDAQAGKQAQAGGKLAA
jgi:hypothetical protein